MQQQPCQSPPASRGASGLGPLIAVNAALLALLAAVTFSPVASAQQRSRASYTMAAGGVNNVQSSAIWVVDTVNQEMMVITYDSASREMKGLAYRDLAADAADLTRGRTRAGG